MGHAFSYLFMPAIHSIFLYTQKQQNLERENRIHNERKCWNMCLQIVLPSLTRSLYILFVSCILHEQQLGRNLRSIKQTSVTEPRPLRDLCQLFF